MRERFLVVAEQYRWLLSRKLRTRKEKRAFILLSVEAHALRGEVPRSWWRLLRPEETKGV
jgi:hypothetical protein